MLKVAIGHSEDPNSEHAIASVLQQCKEELGDTKPQSGILFASITYQFPTLVKAVRSQYPDIHLAGCSTSGELSSKLGVTDESVALILFASKDIAFISGLANNISQDTKNTAQKASKQLLDKLGKKPSLCLTFPDGLSKTDVVAVLDGIKESLSDSHFPLAGANAGDNLEMLRSYQINDDEIMSDAASILFFSEPLICSTVISHGMTPVSNKHLVTKAKDNVVYMLDNKPILDIYNYYMGIHQDWSYGGYGVYSPLAIYTNKDSEDYFIRAPFSWDNKVGSMVFSGVVPENSYVRLVKSNKSDTLKAATDVTKKAIKAFKGKKIVCALVFSCVVRKEILGTSTEKELELIKEELPENTPIFGFYTYGEIAPSIPGGETTLYNHSIAIVLLGE